MCLLSFSTACAWVRYFGLKIRKKPKYKKQNPKQLTARRSSAAVIDSSSIISPRSPAPLPLPEPRPPGRAGGPAGSAPALSGAPSQAGPAAAGTPGPALSAAAGPGGAGPGSRSPAAGPGSAAGRPAPAEPAPSEERQEQNRKFRLIKHLLILQKLRRPLRNPPETCAAPVIFCYIIFLVKYFPRPSPQRGSNITVTNRNQCALTY